MYSLICQTVKPYSKSVKKTLTNFIKPCGETSTRKVGFIVKILASSPQSDQTLQTESNICSRRFQFQYVLHYLLTKQGLMTFHQRVLASDSEFLRVCSRYRPLLTDLGILSGYFSRIVVILYIRISRHLVVYSPVSYDFASCHNGEGEESIFKLKASSSGLQVPRETMDE